MLLTLPYPDRPGSVVGGEPAPCLLLASHSRSSYGVRGRGGTGSALCQSGFPEKGGQHTIRPRSAEHLEQLPPRDVEVGLLEQWVIAGLVPIHNGTGESN